jgi:hypothetical protein
MNAMILKFSWLACLGSFVLISKIFNEYATLKNNKIFRDEPKDWALSSMRLMTSAI